MRTLIALFSTLLLMSPATVVAQQTDRSTSAGSRWGADYFPNVPLTTHEGETVRFFDDLIKDKVVMINFIYTSCPDSCPLETARMLEVQGILGNRVGRDVYMYSISIDPDTDTPEVLARYAANYQVGPGWTFLTGREEDITLLRTKLGLYIDEIQSEDSNDHNLSLIIGNQATGRWMTRSPFVNPYVLANEVGDWLHNWRDARPEGQSYDEAPELRNISKGENLFRTRCSVCHTIGPGDGLFRAGPNLLGVTDRRDPEWLDRWLSDPAKMLAAKDPAAVELFKAYNEVAMPNLRLNELERSYLLEYVATESRRVEQIFKVEAIELPSPEDGPSCCQKQDNVVLTSEPDAELILVGNVVEASQRNVFHLSPTSWLSIGVGFILGVIAIFLKMGSALSHKVEVRSQAPS